MTAPAVGETITRPNGKPYRPRKVTGQVIGEDDEGVLILGTHDLARAQALADQMAAYVAGPGHVAARPWRGWFRDGFEAGRRQWVTDEVRGRAGVCFREIVEAPPVPGYVAPAARVLTVLHRQDPRTWPADEPATRTVCGEPMLADELWVAVERRETDKVCAGCESPETVTNDVQEALL